MASTHGRAARPPLNQRRLEELGLRYVGRYATTRAKLRVYLSRKVRERGWDEPGQPDLEALANRLASLGYIDDAAYALSKSQALTGRGYGRRRVIEKLRLAGVAEEDGAAAAEHADKEAVASALRFASRRRIGPYAAAAADPKLREKWMAAMVRAGHSFALAQAVTRLAPGADVNVDEIAELGRFVAR